jgi:tRNA(fMet)-specific endonuclease VapC
VLLDTSFLIDLQRDLKGDRPRGADRFLQARSTEQVCISLISWMEFAEGYGPERREACREFLSRFPLVPPDIPIAWRASRLSRHVREQGGHIGDHDLWIAATALELATPVVTRNVKHFRLIPELQVIVY